MSAYTTIRITRSKAKEEWLKTLMQDPSDDKLEEFIDDLLRDRLYNCMIVPDHAQNDNSYI